MKARIGQALAVVLGTTLMSASFSAHASTLIDPKLSHFFQKNNAEKINVLVILKETKEFQKPLRNDKKAVFSFLKDKSSLATRTLQAAIEKQGLENETSILTSHWINNTITLQTTARGLRELAKMDFIKKIYANGTVGFDKTAISTKRSDDEGNQNYAFIDTGRYQLMTENPDINGSGVVIGSVDTGIDGDHPALKGKIPYFFNASTGKIDKPFDADQHGTHTAGTMVGSPTKEGFDFGIATSASLVGSAALGGYDEMLSAMEWIINPDGNSKTYNDLPRAINNSWNTNGAPDQEMFYKAIDAWDAAGILPVFSAGNAGPSPKSITHPHEYPLTFAVGATGENGKITDFSSRGPGIYHKQEVQKPNITAPGGDVYSSIPGGQYAKFSGTSMAAPHVTGTVALLCQVNPALTTDELRMILTATAIPTSSEGDETEYSEWNAVYGFGKLNIYNAVQETLYYSSYESGLNSFSLNSVFNLDTLRDLRIQTLQSLRNRKVEFNPESNDTTDGNWISLDNI